MGEVTNDELDDLVEEWHLGLTARTGLPLGEFMAAHLGWTVDDVNRWAADASYRPAHKDGRAVTE